MPKITPLQSVSIITKVVSSNPVHGEVYSIQHNDLHLHIGVITVYYWSFEYVYRIWRCVCVCCKHEWIAAAMWYSGPRHHSWKLTATI